MSNSAFPAGGVAKYQMFQNGPGNGPPFFYDYVSTRDGIIQPSTVHVTNTGLSRFFQRYLFQKAEAVFKWQVPKTWALNYMLACLYLWGYVAIVNTNRYGVVPQQCSLKGYDIFYQPTHAVVANPLLRGILEPRIGVQCTLLRLQPDYGGVYDLVSFYADQMALAAQSYGVNALNSKLCYLFLANKANAGQSLRKMYDQIASGEPAVIVDKSLFDSETDTQNYRLETIQGCEPEKLADLLNIIKQLEIQFDQTVGIPNVSTTRRERELTSELAANDNNTKTLADQWLVQLQETCEQARNMFGIELSVDWRWDDESLYDNVGDVSVEQGSVRRASSSSRT